MNRNEEWQLFEDYLKLKQLNKEIGQIDFGSLGLNADETEKLLAILLALRNDMVQRIKKQLQELRML